MLVPPLQSRCLEVLSWSMTMIIDLSIHPPIIAGGLLAAPASILLVVVWCVLAFGWGPGLPLALLVVSSANMESYMSDGRCGIAAASVQDGDSTDGHCTLSNSQRRGISRVSSLQYERCTLPPCSVHQLGRRRRRGPYCWRLGRLAATPADPRPPPSRCALATLPGITI